MSEHGLVIHMYNVLLVFHSSTEYRFPKQQILDSSKLREFADDNYKFDENGGKFFKWIGNTVGKGEIACYEQFLLFPQCFLKTCTDMQKQGIVWDRVNGLLEFHSSTD